MTKAIMQDAESRMKKSIEVLRKELSTVRAGRANPSLLDKITLDYYGTPTPINQVGNISVPEARLLVIQPYDRGMIGAIEKAIMKSDLGITPANDGNVIRIAIPPLNEERRKELVKQVHKKSEEEKVALRNIRRDAIDTCKAKEKAKEITEDEQKKFHEDIQKITDRYIMEIDKISESKQQEIMEV